MQVRILNGLGFTKSWDQTPLQQLLDRRAMYRAVAVLMLGLGLAWHHAQGRVSESANLHGALCLWGALSYFACVGVSHRLGRRVALLIILLSLAQAFGLDPVLWVGLARKIPQRIVGLSHDHLLMGRLMAWALGVIYAACTDLLHEARVRSLLQRQSTHPHSSPVP